MLKKTITYEDYNGTKRTEDFYFNLSKPELINLQVESPMGMETELKNLMDNQDSKEIMRIFREFILGSYGEKSADGLRFTKTPEMRLAFEQSPAYEELFMQLVTDADEASKFFNGIIPAGLAEQVNALNEKAGKTAIAPVE